MGKGDGFFIVGLLFFLIAHIFYIFMVLKLLKKVKLNQLIFASLPYVLIFIVLVSILYNGLGSMKIPVIVYAITISVFGTVSLVHYFQEKTKIALLLVIGVFIFIVSDVVLALNLFYIEHTFYPLLIMSTYVLAQYLICRFALLKIQN